MPFFWCTVLGLVLITVFPEIATWLPDFVIEKK
jgi:TRAP-type C4-dicarboxylate transport system permease large subunit